MNRAADLLLEIGTEELPAAYLPSLIEQLGTEAQKLFAANHLTCRQVESFGTPRRLVLLVEGLAATQRKPGEDVRGPSKQAAYDAAGKPTKALEGFLRSQGGAAGQLKVVSTGKGEYVYLVKPPTQISTTQVLPELLSKLIGALRAPKTMRWDSTGARFARPIRWLLALYGSQPIRCTFGRLASTPSTCMGSPTRPRAVPVRSSTAYRQALKRSGIVLEQDARRARIQALVAGIARQAGGAAAPEMISHGLLEEVTHLVEEPVALAGGFDSKFLELPREVLLASMAKYQRVFAIESSGKLLPKFVAILEGKPGKPAAVRAVIERILNARLADSLTFWEQDRKRSLTDMVQELGGVTFHERLGSMADKVNRLHRLAAVLETAWSLTPEQHQQLRRAAELAKADLVSALVREFPTLQGVMGKYYAKASGSPDAVAVAIEEHYLPLAGRSPKTLIGSALSILDKYDTLASYFSIGIEPTGDQDPFGLRRAAQGIVEVAWAVKRSLPLQALFDARAAMPHFLPTDTPDPVKERNCLKLRIQHYILERLYTFAWPKPAPAPDYIDAVLAGPCDDLVDVMDRIVSLRRLDGDPGLRKAAKVVERTANILKGSPAKPQDGVDPAQLHESLERQLFDLYKTRKSAFTDLVQEKSYVEATKLFAETFFEPLHEFFDKVLVNVEDEALRRNRLALMHAIHALYTDRIADLSKLTLLQQKDDSG